MTTLKLPPRSEDVEECVLIASESCSDRFECAGEDAM